SSTRVEAVVTQPDRPAGRGRKTSMGIVKRVALDHGVAVLQPGRLRSPDQLEPLLDLAPELIVVASFGQILPQRLLDVPRFGCLNLHPSLLPRLRGPSPIATAILNGDDQTGTTVMLMNAQMDEGPIIAQEAVPVGARETAGELERRLAARSAHLLAGTLPGWLAGRFEPVPQDSGAATYSRIIRKEDGVVDWRLPAPAIARRIQAFNPWPVATTTWDGRPIRLLRATAAEGRAEPGRVVGLAGSAIAVGSDCGLVLVEELQVAGKRVLDAPAFARGYPAIVGARLGGE
ncbi:MAG TPA: methionyl-tRNA formyltransferase, partial [Chloroflexota bacterium]|nr:methionyl-tRNA formyltransferase [Chloroflexota bacterium]